MLRRSPIKRKRETPRRGVKSGRVIQARMKPKAKAAPDAIEKAHIDRIAGFGCLVCGRPGHVHHLMVAPGKIRRRDHRWVVPLCPMHHQDGRVGVHGIGSERAFEELHGLGVNWLQRWAYAQWLISSNFGMQSVSAEIPGLPRKSKEQST